MISDQTHIIRPRLSWDGVDLTSRSFKTVRSFNGIQLERKGRLIHVLGRELDADTADGIGRVLIELAEAAKEEPDPALLRDLKDTLGDSHGLMEMDADRMARAILLHFDVKPKGDAQ
ncbi:hypothetical protein ABT340_39250 [Streptosporangium sp. NPDC000239]|uniref:hypothetical protein n=1 Tax=Streptosporangium sp. NPDC000239 TaxID=3154248 RepID=UPI0033184EAC